MSTGGEEGERERGRRGKGEEGGREKGRERQQNEELDQQSLMVVC